MTISTSQSSQTFLGNGATNSFNFTFVGDSSADIVVTYTDTLGTTITLSPSQYTIALNAAAAGALWGIGGTVTYPIMGAPIANGTSLTISRVLPLTQETSISNQGAFAPEVIEAALDTLEMQLQQVAARSGQFRGVWSTAVLYNFADIVIDGANGTNTGNYYNCALANTSGTWSTDLAAGDWTLAIDIQTINTSVTAAAASATSAANSASSASGSASSASSSASSASSSASSAAISATNAAASAGSIATLFKINVQLYGADPTGVADSSAAYAAALAAANTQYAAAISPGLPITTGALYWPAGDYRIDTGATVSTCNVAMVTEGKESVRIKLGAGQVFLTVTGAIYQFDCQNAFNISGGKGFLNQTYTSSNIFGATTISGNDFYGYTGACIGSLASDFPYWRIDNNIFQGATALTSKGIVFNVAPTQTVISRNAFLRNLYHIQMPAKGGSLNIIENDFIRFTNGAGSPKLTDIWFIPSASSSILSENLVITLNKFGNENLNTADYRILLADLGSGTNAFDKVHSTSVSIGFFGGPAIENNTVLGVSNFTQGFIYSYTENVWYTKQSNDFVGGANIYPYYLQFDAGVTISNSRNLDSNLIDIGTPTNGAEVLQPLLSNAPSAIIVENDPLGLQEGMENFIQTYSAGSDPSYINLLNSNTISGASTTTCALSPITDSRGGSNATTATFSGVNGALWLSVNTGNITVGRRAYIEVDIEQAASLPITSMQVMIRENALPLTPVFRRFIYIPTSWSTIRFPWVPRTGATAINLWFQVNNYSAGVATKLNIGLPKLYHAHEPINFGANYLKNSATYNPPSLNTLTTTTTTVTVTGAALGDFAVASFSLDTTGVMFDARVTSANTVTVILFNPTAGTLDLASGTLTVQVFKNQ